MGHLSNRHTAEFLTGIYNQNLRNVWLCHLSQDNNRPEIAFRTVEQALLAQGAETGKNIRLEALSRHKVSGLREF
jgi:phosphoribosyl 1,2-cyclic phosphodiesterase